MVEKEVKKEDMVSLLKEKGYSVAGAVVVVDDFDKKLEVYEIQA